ncbi:phosphotransferase family protein [Azospirillum sp. B4]|uniref:phosphotransferase family protein n=1 Tax=Azospirillum sp. B4 TaxID=95605 RepID=UPI0003491E3F|nr:aminoglycoside phosphotransferase family protein [Azospirillum sp. B4]
MPSSGTEIPPRLPELASRLVGCAVHGVAPCSGGGNNRVYRVETDRGTLALKLYPALADDPRDRLSHEYTALSFLNGRVGAGLLPRAIAADPVAGAALYEWVEGRPVVAHDVDDAGRVVQLLADLRQAGSDAAAVGAAGIGPAIEPCLAPADILQRLATRLAALDPVSAGEPGLADLLERIRALMGSLADALGSEATAPLPATALTLSPSDFGFHNALRRDDGSLTFLDFEYFGWDDPAKAVSDFLWHAGQTLTAAQRVSFVAGAVGLYGGAPFDFAHRLVQIYPLHGLNWVLIILNEFRPDCWRRRQLAGHTDTWATAKARQLAKAEKLLERVRLAYQLQGSLLQNGVRQVLPFRVGMDSGIIAPLQDWIARTGPLIGNEA